MRSLGTTAVLLAFLLTGCGSGGDDADDVPTITTRPSTPESTTPSESPTSETPSTSAPVTSQPTETSAPPSPTPTETGPSPEPPTDEPTGPTTYRQATARIADAGPPIASPIARFSTVEDLIYCLLDDPVIGPACELRSGFVKDDEVCGGAAEGVGRIETFEGEARPVCNTDTIREPGAQVISGDGVVSDGAGVECLVDAAAPGVSVTCVDRSARTGFFLAPREYHVF